MDNSRELLIELLNELDEVVEMLKSDYEIVPHPDTKSYIKNSIADIVAIKNKILPDEKKDI